MARNIEIKAVLTHREQVEKIITGIADQGPETLVQTDVFFNVNFGRLKLRRFPEAPAQLIAYHRPDTEAPSESQYQIYQTDDPDQLHEALSAASGILGVVKKTRTLYLVGKTRIHLDDVENLGNFLELEVVLDKNDTAGDGEKIASELMQILGIQKSDLLKFAYIDLLLSSNSTKH